MEKHSFTDEQLLNLINNTIKSKTEFSEKDFTGGGVQITSTYNHKIINFLTALVVGTLCTVFCRRSNVYCFVSNGRSFKKVNIYHGKQSLQGHRSFPSALTTPTASCLVVCFDPRVASKCSALRPRATLFVLLSQPFLSLQ